MLLVILLGSLPTIDSAQASVTVINESSYPWLVQGAYADYTSMPANGAPAFVLQNGTVLLSIPPAGPPTLPQGTANTTLDWTVLNRTSDMAWISVVYHTEGCEYSLLEHQDHSNCTHFDYNDALVFDVNVTDGETYLDGSSVGRLNFWGPPLITGGAVYSGTAIIGGTPHDSLDNVTWYSNLNLGISITTATGVTTGPYDAYQLMPTLFGYGSNYTFAYETVSGPPQVSPMSVPGGLYDYYNGLAIQLWIPQYPIDQTVCSIQKGQLENCRVTTYATTLGTFFRSGGAPLDLSSTNIPIGANQPNSVTTQSQSTASQSSSATSQSNPTIPGETTLILVLAIIAAAAAGSGFYVLHSRKPHNRTDIGRDRGASFARTA